MLRALIALLALSSAASARHDVVAEAEEFKIVRGPFRVIGIEEAYYAATLSNTFSSRQKLLSAPESGPTAEAVHTVQIPAAGQYRVWSRYELPADWTAEHTIRVEQGGRVVLERTYGLAASNKVWTMHEGFRPWAHFSWGSGDNVTWEPSDPIALAAGPAKVTLIAGPQQAKGARGGARRNLDVLLFTDDLEFGLKNVAAQTWHTLDQVLSQEGECWFRVSVPASAPAPMGATVFVGTHSPYLQPRGQLPRETELVPPGGSSAWLPLGQALDRLNMQELHVLGHYKPIPGQPARTDAEFDFELAADPQGKRIYRRFHVSDPVYPKLVLEIPADLRQAKPGIRSLAEWHEELLAEVKKFPPHGRVPTEVPIYGVMGGPWPWNSKVHDRRRALADETGLILGRNVWRDGELTPGLAEKFGVKLLPNLEIDLRGTPPKEMDKALHALGPELERVKVINLGDELSPWLLKVEDEAVQTRYREWLRAQKSPLDPQTARLVYEPTGDLRPYYWSMKFTVESWIRLYGERTAAIEKVKPDLIAGINFTPHPQYWPSAYWFWSFQQHGLSLPWAEDWVFQIPEASTEITGYLCDAMRAAAPPGKPIEMYTIPHWPGQTARDLSLSFFSALAHGNKLVNFFTAKPLYDYTENWVAWTARDTWKAVYDLVHDLGTGDDLIARGWVRPAKTVLLASGVNDVYDGALKQSWANFERKNLWYALRNGQVPVDFLAEESVADGKLASYEVMYVVGEHLLARAIEPLRKWVEKGGTLVLLGGGPFRDESDAAVPALTKLLGVAEVRLTVGTKSCWAKECLAFLEPMATVEGSGLPALVARAHLKPAAGVAVKARFTDGSAAILEHALGRGRVITYAFLPGAAYMQKAIPKRPFCRGTSDDSFNHFLPTDFDERAAELILEPVRALPRHVTIRAGEKLAQVDANAIDSAGGIAVPIANYSGKPLRATVEVTGAAGVKSVEAARAGKLQFRLDGDRLTTELPIDWVDLLVLRR